MAALKSDPQRRDAKTEDPGPSALARVVLEFEDLVADFEMVLICDQDSAKPRPRDEDAQRRDDIRQQARRLAIAELSSKYTRKSIRTSLAAAESLGKRAEEELHSASESVIARETGALGSIHDGHFRLHSTELFDMLGQPTDLRFGTLRFLASQERTNEPSTQRISLELALNSSFFVADSAETLPFHSFNIPDAPSIQNHGILSRKLEDGGAFPDYDSWLLFTFLGNGCLKVEIPIEMCADVYGGALRGRENEEILFWGIFVQDEDVS